MHPRPPFPLIAVDVGNARTKLGLFREEPAGALPEPETVLSINNRTDHFAGDVNAWLAPLAARPVGWWIGSVNRPAAARLVDWLHENRPDDPVTLLSAVALPLRVALARPERVGIDRLLDAVAANHLRASGRPAVVIDLGTAITVDLISADGAFCGGAILPGIALSARALHEFTDRLPLVETSELTDVPSPIGTSTESAIQSGLFWGAVGAIRELIRQMTATLPAADSDPTTLPDLFLTGGAAPAVADLLDPAARCIPHLALMGIALAVRAMRKT